jgi:starch synthase
LPSIQDGYAISVIQAIACGIPVIVTKNTGAEEYVLKNNCGFVVNIRSSKEILHQLNKLKDDEKLEINYRKIV